MNDIDKLFVVRTVLFLTLIFLVLSSSGYAIAPGLVQAPDSPGRIQNGYIQDQALNGGAGGDMMSDISQAEVFTVAIVYDWDNDGKKDLLIGYSHDYPVTDLGYIRFYRNVGTDANPSFSGFSRVRACYNTCDLIVAAAYPS